MVLCIIPPYFRLIDKIFKKLEQERRSGRTDRETAGRNDRRQYPSALMAAKGNKGVENSYISHLHSHPTIS